MDDFHDIYRAYGEDCNLSAAVYPDGYVKLVVETEEGRFDVDGLELSTLMELLESIACGEPDDTEFH